MSTGTVAASSGAAVAAAAAAEAAREEEERLTEYSPRDLAEDWEFKILRSNTGAFRRPERLKEILDQESRAGWVMVEKFDNARIRLKRPASARQDDRSLDFDPYRTYVGGASNVTVAVFVALLVAGLVAFAVVAALVR
jgi:hypothetical protein